MRTGQTITNPKRLNGHPWLRRLSLCVFGLLLVNLLSGVKAADSIGDAQYAVMTWKDQDEMGLPQDTITSILFSNDGYVWIATLNGLARFDGSRFIVFDTSNTSAFKNNFISQIFEDSRGKLWVGHNTGDVEVYENGSFFRLDVPAAWLGQSVNSFVEDKAGRIWILNRRGWILPVMNLESGTILKSYPKADCLIADRGGRIWTRSADTNGGCRFQTINTLEVEATPPLPGKSLAFASRSGGLWVAEPDKLRRWHKGRWQEERTPFPSLDMLHPTFWEAQDGRLIAGCFKEGLYILETNGKITHVTTATGLANDWVCCLCEDRENNLWVGTGGGGLNMLRPRLVEMPNPPDHWQGKAVLSVTPSGNDGLLIATEGAGIYYLQNNQIRPLAQNPEFPTRIFLSVLETSNHNVWLGSRSHGLFILTNNMLIPAPMPVDTSKNVTSLYADRKNRVWVGTESGVGVFTDGKWDKIAIGPSTFRPDIRCITETTDGSIWLGTMGNGLCRMRDGHLTWFTTTNGLPGNCIWALKESPAGTLWVGTYGKGLSRFKNGKISTITNGQGLPSDVVYDIEADHQGNLWISSDHGIYRATASELNACAAGEISGVHCLLYVRSDGLITREMSGGSQPSGCRMKDGRLAFASRSGLAIVNPEQPPPFRLPPTVHIEDFLVDGKPVPIPENQTGITSATNARPPFQRKVVLPPGQRRIEIGYTGLNFAAPRRVRFRYQLEGLDKDWVDVGTKLDADGKRSVEYSYLSPGNYCFHVIACNSDGVWNTEGASLAFTVLPYFWQTWWFSTSCWLAGSGILAGSLLLVARQRNRRKLEIVERQRVLERERTRIARDIHDELGTSLTRISMFSQSAQDKTKVGRNPEHEVNTIFGIARDITRSMDEIVWAINPKHDTLGSLMVYLANFIEEFLEPAGMNYELDFPPAYTDIAINAEARHDLFLAFKEALNNVVKHSGASRVFISLQVEAHQISLCVQDNGCGFNRQAVQNQPIKPGRHSTGNGLENMQKRLQKAGGSCWIDSTLGQGTCIWFTILIHG